MWGLRVLKLEQRRRFGEAYGALHFRVKHLLEAFIRCGDLYFGFARVRCVNSECTKKDERIVPMG